MFRLHSYRSLAYFYTILLQFGLQYSDGLRFGYWWDMAVLAAERSRSYLISTRPMCLSLHSLTPAQAEFCINNTDHMPWVSLGAHIGIRECQRQFKEQRWNCSSSRKDSTFGVAAEIATRESSFVHAISSAGVVHSISQSCSSGMLARCGCHIKERPSNLDKTWHWDGCGDNVPYARKFAKDFIDLREKENSYQRHSLKLARILINLHNNEVGRLMVSRMEDIKCKCHGVSGSCSLKTCWYKLKPFQNIGAALAKRYESAFKVKFNKRGTALRTADSRPRRPGRRKLIYMDESPDFCRRNWSSGILGTSGRYCIRESSGRNSCDHLCCGRGFYTTQEIRRYNCQCKFVWCCRTKCKICTKKVTTYQCK